MNYASTLHAVMILNCKKETWHHLRRGKNWKFHWEQLGNWEIFMFFWPVLNEFHSQLFPISIHEPPPLRELIGQDES